jgi:hypothetical protein
MLKRTDNLDRINELCNNPQIYPWVHGDLEGQIDIKVIPNPTVILEAEDGAFLFVDKGNGEWDAHTLFPPSLPYTYKLALEAIDYIRSLPGYKKITTQGPRNNPRAIRFLEKLGFTYTHTEGTYQGLPLDYYEKV